jgi:hypothetical protein
MIGSPAVAAFIAQAAFVGLLVYGVLVGELRVRSLLIFVGLGITGRLVLAYLPFQPASAMFPSFVAVLDIALVLVIFKGDVRLT